MRFLVNSDPFLAAIKACSSLASTDKTRPHICGVLVMVKDGILSARATNGYMACLVEIATLGTPVDGECLIPTEECGRLAKTFKGTGQCTVILDDKDLKVDSGPTIAHVSVGLDKYPRLEHVIPAPVRALTHTAVTEQTFDAAYLLDVMSFFKAIAPRKEKQYVRLTTQTDVSDAIRFNADSTYLRRVGILSALAVLMPNHDARCECGSYDDIYNGECGACTTKKAATA